MQRPGFRVLHPNPGEPVSVRLSLCGLKLAGIN